MYNLNKIIGWIFSPLGIMFLGLGLGFVIRRGRRLVIGVVLAFVWMMGCDILTRYIGLPLEGEEKNDARATLVERGNEIGGIVLLGGGMGSHSKCGRAEMYSAADRVWEASKVYKELKARGTDVRVFCTGGGAEKSTLPLLIDLGVPREQVVCLEKPRNTEEEARTIANELKVKSVALVTSAWHMPRAKMLFERAGFKVFEMPTDYEMHCAAEKEIKLADFFPNSESLMRNSYAIKEWVARLGYGLLRR